MARYFRRRKFCRFTAEGVQEIDYKDIATLKTTSPKAVRLSRAVTGTRANTSVSWLALSNALATCPCCRTLIVISNRSRSINTTLRG